MYEKLLPGRIYVHMIIIVIDICKKLYFCYRVKKAFKCKCGKSYKTSQGLRNHTLTHHPPSELVTAVHQQQLHRANLAAVAAAAQAQVAQAQAAGLPQSSISQAQGPVSATNTTLPHTVLSHITQQQQQVLTTTLSSLGLPQSSLATSQHTQQQIQVPASLGSITQNGVHGFQQVPVTTIQTSQLSQVLAAANPTGIVTTMEQPVASQWVSNNQSKSSPMTMSTFQSIYIRPN